MNSDVLNRQFSFFLAVCSVSWAVFIVYGSLLPFDFKSIPWGNFSQQFLSLNKSDAAARSITDLLTNIAIFMPVAFFGLGAALTRYQFVKKISLVAIFLFFCMILSLGIEWFQMFFPPRNSSIFDVIANSLGSFLGVLSWLLLGERLFNIFEKVCLFQQNSATSLFTVPKFFIFGLFVSSVFIILTWSGVFFENWIAVEAIGVKWQTIQLVPFLAHQAADIFHAVVSIVIAVCVFGLFGITLRVSNFLCNYNVRFKITSVAMITSILAVSVEVLKFFLETKNPETGNVVIAGVAGSLSYFLAPCLKVYLTYIKLNFFQEHANVPEGKVTSDKVVTNAFILERTLAALCGISIVFLVATYPIGGIQLGLGLIIYGLILLKYSRAWLIVIPGLLPVLDLTPWIGRHLLAEYDAVVLTTLLIGFWRYAGKPIKLSASRLFWFLLIAFLLSYFVSTVIGVLPLQPLDTNAFSSPYSYYSALIMAKGGLFAIGLFVLMSHQSAAGQPIQRDFSIGMTIGLLLASASVIWERLAYVSLTDFTETFRVVGLFSTMNTGGPHLDAFLISAFPFVLMLAIQSKSFSLKLIYSTILALGVYAIMMTFSRAAFASMVVILVIIICWNLLPIGRKTVENHKRGISVLISFGIVCAMITPVLLGSFMQSRLSGTHSDLSIRFNNWLEATSIMTETWSAKMFGMGLGRYPESYQWLATTNSKPAMHGFEQELENTFLRLGNGATLYVEQIVSPNPDSDYQLTLQARTSSGQAKLNVLLCDRTYLDGFDCQSVTLKLSENKGQWQSFEVMLNSKNVGKNKLRLSKISFENAGSTVPIDIDNVSIRNSKGIDILSNGDFQAGADHWYFSSPNNYSPWRVENLFLHIFFEQGWIGLTFFCLLIAMLIGRLSALAIDGSSFAVTTLASVMGFVVVGTFDSMFDAPRLVMVFGLLVAMTGIFRPTSVVAIETPKTSQKLAEIDQDELSAYKQKGRIDVSVIRQDSWRKIALLVFGKLMLLSVAIAVFTRLPFIPYNIRELVNPNHPVIAPVIFAAFLIWVFGLPATIARWSLGSTIRGFYFISLLFIHGVIAWILLQFAVLPESIHDIIGSPVWNWPGQTEYIFRFVPFVSVLTLQFVGGALFLYSHFGRLAAARLWWIITAIILMPIQYWIIVKQASTDNITELMANNASIGAFLLLSAYLFLLGYAGALIAAFRFKIGIIQGLKLACLIIISLPIAYFFVSYGTSATIIKEKQIFSALQFLLSPDRDNYVSGFMLLINFAIAHFVLVGLIATSHIYYEFKHNTIR